MTLSLDEHRQASLRHALTYAKEVFALMPAHWLRPGVVADVETLLDQLTPKSKHGQESKFGFPGSQVARRHIARLLRSPEPIREEL